MAKDMSKAFFIYNGYSIKSIRNISYDEPENEFEQSESDIYGEFDNLYSPNKKIVFTITIPIGELDELTLDTFKAAKVEAPGTYIDKRGSNNNTIAFDKAVIQKKTKTIDKTPDVAEYTIIARRILNNTIKA